VSGGRRVEAPVVASKISALIAEAVGERPDGPSFDAWLQSRVGERDAN
jgi:hypothetical protein